MGLIDIVVMNKITRFSCRLMHSRYMSLDYKVFTPYYNTSSNWSTKNGHNIFILYAMVGYVSNVWSHWAWLIVMFLV